MVAHMPATGVTIDHVLLRLTRRRKGLTLAKVAQRAGTTAGYVSKLEGGTAYPSPSIAVAIAEVLGLDFDELVLDMEVQQ